MPTRIEGGDPRLRLHVFADVAHPERDLTAITRRRTETDRVGR